MKKQIEKACIGCGQIFQPSSGKQKYCNENCWQHYYRLKTGQTHKPHYCKQCGKEFYYGWRQGNRKHCSEECGRLSAIAYRKNFYNRHPEARKRYAETVKKKHIQDSPLDRFLKHYPQFERKCMVCGESRVVDLHHFVPRNGAWRKASNCTPETCWVLCPNHHAMLERGVATPEDLDLK